MTNYQAIYSHDGIKFFKSTGSGTTSDPYIPTVNTTGGDSGGGTEFDTATNFEVTMKDRGGAFVEGVDSSSALSGSVVPPVPLRFKATRNAN